MLLGVPFISVQAIFKKKKKSDLRGFGSVEVEGMIKLSASHLDAGSGLSRASWDTLTVPQTSLHFPLQRCAEQLQRGGTEQMVNVCSAHACHHHLH